MNDMKEAKVRALQSCAKVVQCPPDTAYFYMQSSARHRQFLDSVMGEADLVIVDIGQEHYKLDGAEGGVFQGFSDSRLAGLLRKSPSANYIFTLQVPAH